MWPYIYIHPGKFDVTLCPPWQNWMWPYVHPVKLRCDYMSTLAKLDVTLCPPWQNWMWPYVHPGKLDVTLCPPWKTGCDLIFTLSNLDVTILNWWKGKLSGSIACTRKRQPRFYWSCSYVNPGKIGCDLSTSPVKNGMGPFVQLPAPHSPCHGFPRHIDDSMVLPFPPFRPTACCSLYLLILNNRNAILTSLRINYF